MTIRRWALGVACSAGLLALIGFSFPHQLLCVDSGRSQADFLVVLGGEVDIRAGRAAELYRHGAAPKVIVSGRGDCGLGRTVLRAGGVPKGCIQVESQSRNTKENAEFSVRLLRSAGAKRAIIVTSWSHSRRALACFRHAAPEIQFDSAPAYPELKWSDWGGHNLGLAVGQEYLKIGYYGVRYGIWSVGR